MTSATGRRFLCLAAVLLVAGCEGGPQSALAPAGRDASDLARLFWIMLAGAVVLWIALNGLFLFVTRIRPGALSRGWAEGIIIGGGIALPLVVLTALLVYALPLMPAQRAPGDGLTVRVTGEQWWWRVEYRPEGAEDWVTSANEIRLPVGQRTEIELTSGEVIHSFWIPALGGKTDMFPGRTTRMTLLPEEAGIFRGQCAEFCGLSHALMALNAVALEPAEFEAWLAAEAGPATLPRGEGAALFAREGCGACHSVRGTDWAGQVGPDLTHFGSRTSLAAGTLPLTREALVGWIADPGAVKPGAEMPSYGHMTTDELATLSDWLMGLQ
ncbi:cytochrome c oxidase subunit II [Wenxinia saemankumensis]|uniref:Cytochrome c oxidase subunit 2 n=1 Tax=Wenxinia saemankumensis TaxID=1447782 RepID=A0A1M6HBT4_9RHOB|nr:cytochrome c oxidase subunit II [Wenxinia saemankumensis]SHJ19559.1 cytochrome c oxidase subunit 2 [Wenxinia saemankumensis]